MSDALRELLVIRMKATAMLQMQMATALNGKGQDALRSHLIDSATLLLDAAKELRPSNEGGARG